ncbi:MAG TPA: hypothetical protein VFU23_11010, partial [Gemmatimonadales bacterium]|nr:hypothetical protein [Gemmatimonadales bacterium]
EVRLDSFTGTLLGTGSGVVNLPGNNGSPTPVTFRVGGTGIPRQTGNHTFWFKLSFTNLPGTRKIQVWYNSSFANNSPCKDAKVYAPTYPASTTFKAGLSIVVTN